MKDAIRLLALGALLCVPAVTLAQTSPLYITNFDWPPVHHVVQNGEVINEWQTGGAYGGDYQWAMAVTDTIKIFASSADGMGYEYSLDGEMLLGTYPNPGFNDCFDGATSGTQNWTIAHNDTASDFAVLVADADWGSAAVAFVPQRRSSGITYDGNTGTLWVTNTTSVCDRVQQYSLEGDLLSEFAVDDIFGGYGIAWDPADDTLWISQMCPFGEPGPELHQFDKQGNLLQSVDLPGVAATVFGATGLEFQMVPEPASALLLVIGALAIVRRR
ncbi:MAG: PEP-CTERM sorting domain-containing protein [Phycisphaerae bacterium]|jgi:hypothetical protein